MVKYIEFEDALGKTHKIDMGGVGGKFRDKEIEAVKAINEGNAAILEQLKDSPEAIAALLSLSQKYKGSDQVQQNPTDIATASLPETPVSCDTAIESYITKLETQGRKGKRLSPKTLLGYKGRLKFWAEVFGERFVHEITLKDISDIQAWLTNFPTNYLKKGISTKQSLELAQGGSHKYATISDVTRADYLGQLKGFFEYAFASGHIKQDMAHHVEIPNAKHSKAVHRLPFTNGDLKKIFNPAIL